MGVFWPDPATLKITGAVDAPLVSSVNDALPRPRRKPPELDDRRTPSSALFLARRG